MQTIAIFLSLRTIEEWLDPLGISLQSFGKEMLGSWVFGYIKALHLAGVRTILFCISNRVDKVTRITHMPTGVIICVLPAPRFCKYLDRTFSTSHENKSLEINHFNLMAKAYQGIKVLLGSMCGYLRTPLLRLGLELVRERCSALLVQEYETARFDLCVLIGRLLRVPTFGCFQYEIEATKWNLNPLRFLSVQFSSGLIIPTASELRRVRNQYRQSSKKLAQIPNPVDLRIWYPVSKAEARKNLGIPDTSSVVVWHGQVESRKGIDLLIEAWEQLCAMRPTINLRLLMVGTGSYSHQLSSLIKDRQLRGVVWINKWINEPGAIRQYLGCGDIFVFPSRVEGFPVAPIEAMACGLPVVAANASGIEDIFEGGEDSGGIVVPRGDVGALATALIHLLDNPELVKKLGMRARARVEASFSLENIGHQLSAFLLNSQPNALPS